MIIKKLELQGFKSFPDKTKLMFHPGITAVIGPNGTGKSNIVDALLWVLRGRRLKALRGDRSGDVIFNGNEKKAPLGMSDVSLFLGNDDKEMKINHRVFRSGESEYRMDGKSARLKEIQDALWKSSIGETNYFVIEQGSIGAFLSSKPLEKRALLEEAAGTAFYKEKKRQAENKLENTEQNLLRLEDIINEVSKGKNSLQRQASAAKRYRKYREKIRELTLLLFRKKLHLHENEKREINENYQKHLDIEKELINRLKAEEKGLSEINKKAWLTEKNLNEDKENLYSLKSQITNLNLDRERENKRIEDFQEKKKKAQQELKELKQELEVLTGNKEEERKNLQIYQDTLKGKKVKLEKAEKSKQRFLEELSKKEKNIEYLRNEYLQKMSFSNELKNSETQLGKERELLLRQQNKIDSELESENHNLLEMKQEIENQKKETAEAQKSVEEKRERLIHHQKSIQEEIQMLAQLEAEIEKLKKTKAEHSHHLNALEKLKQKERDSHKIPELKSSFQMLADVMEADEEKAMLIDIFYKQEAKSLLMDPDDFIHQLSKGRLKGNFLLLHPQQNIFDQPRVKNEPQVLGFLKNHIKLEPKIKDYVTLLPEAVIVKELKDAVNLWIRYPEYNFITLEGDTLLSSGLIKSGEKKEGLLAFTRETKSLALKISQLENKIKPLEEKLIKHQELINNLEKNITQIQSNISEKEQNSKVLKKNINYAEEQKEKIKSKIKFLKNEKQKLNEENLEIIKQKNEMSSKIQKSEEEKESLKNIIKQEEKKIESLQEKKEQENKDYFKIQTEIDVIKEKIIHIKNKSTETEQRIDSINRKLKNLEKDMNESKQEEELLKKKILDIKQNLKKLEQLKDEKEEALTQDEEKEYDIQKQLSSREGKMKELREQFEQAKENRIKWEIKKAEKERDLLNFEESCWQELKKTPEEVKKGITLPEAANIDIEKSISENRENLEKIGSVNLMAEDEYNTQKKRYDFLVNQRQDLRESIESTKKAIKKIDSESKSQFLSALIKVNKNFQDIFSALFNGGYAQIKLSEEDNPLESVLEITAQPPGKKVKNLTLLSGGEKTLTSLAFFFALFRYKPAPFCILDEVDAALDETNLNRFLNLMKEIKTHTQFIIITHNFKTMEVADYIYGTAMPEPNITHVYSVKLKEKQILKDS
jgi:chromosome segregation protein